MIIAFGSQKGGVGKSTTLISVAVELMARGRSVLVVDADPQGTTRTWAEVAAEQAQPTPTTVAMGNTMHKPDQLPRLAATYDFVLIDCPPRLGDVQRSALMIADVIVMPCGPSAADAWALGESLELVEQAQQLRPELRALGLITRKMRGTAIGRGAREVLKNTRLEVLDSELGYRVAYQEAIGAGSGPTKYEPTGAAAEEVRALVDELTEAQPTETIEVQHA
jgi:chromosome partitioning protein